MIKIKKIQIPAQVARVVIKEVYVCDLCGKEGTLSTCAICGRNICRDSFNKCSKREYGIGDEEILYCLICYKFFYKKFKAEYDKIEEDAYKAQEKLIEIIKTKSLNL